MLNIIEVHNLPKQMKQPYVKLVLVQSIDGRQVKTDLGRTEAQSYEIPVFNKRFQFSVANEGDTVWVIIQDDRLTNVGQNYLEMQVTMRELKQHMDNPSIEIKELWFHFEDPEKDPNSPSVRI